MSDSEFNIKIGKRIKRERLKLGLTREKLSQMADISDKFLYDIEVGNKGMSTWTLYKIAKALDITTDWLICGYEMNKGEDYYSQRH